MAWPTPQDYNEVIQNPVLCFEDADLRAGTPELTALGLPRPNSGAFASVYRMYNGSTSHAVRCFLRNITDQEDRYKALTEYICHDSFESTVPFIYISKGILVHGQWYPLLKMDWVDGVTLEHFVRDNLTRSNTLRSLAQSFLKMHLELNREGVAHGDLQHGNIMVARGALRLVDYDGMYIPSLSGKTSNEIGHPNYQHPVRDRTDFGPFLDNFSAWVIYTSLIALSVDKSLCDRLNGLDDCLLFRARDFRDPEGSNVFQLLERHQSSEVSLLTKNIRSFLKSRPKDVPVASDEPAEPRGLPDLPVIIKIKRTPDWSLGGGDLVVTPSSSRDSSTQPMPWYAEPLTKQALADKSAVRLVVDPVPTTANLPAHPGGAPVRQAVQLNPIIPPVAPRIGGWTVDDIRDHYLRRQSGAELASAFAAMIGILCGVLSIAFMFINFGTALMLFVFATILCLQAGNANSQSAKQKRARLAETIINTKPHTAKFYFEIQDYSGSTADMYCTVYLRSCDSADIFNHAKWTPWRLLEAPSFLRRHPQTAKHEYEVEAWFSPDDYHPLAMLIDGNLEWFK